MFQQGRPLVHRFRNFDGSVQQHYPLPTSAILPLTIAEGKAIITYGSMTSTDPQTPITYSLSFGPNQTKSLWDYNFQLAVYTIEPGP